MKQNIFVIGDIHGEYAMLEKMLAFWNPQDQQLLFIGDLIDRGKDPAKCLTLVQKLVEEEGAICLKGNHENMLLNFLSDPETYVANYFINGGMTTLETLLKEEIQNKSPKKMAQEIEKKHRDLIQMIKQLPLYFEWNQYVFVHAGVDLSKQYWKDTDSHDFLWIREPFHQQKNHTGKTIVFGHTPTFLLHGDQANSQIWQQDDKIGIDGGAVFGGTLHGIVFDKTGMKHHYGVRKNEQDEITSEIYL